MDGLFREVICCIRKIDSNDKQCKALQDLLRNNVHIINSRESLKKLLTISNCNIIYQAMYSYKYYVVEYLLRFHIVEQCIRLESIAASNNPGKASSILHSYYNEILTSIITPSTNQLYN